MGMLAYQRLGTIHSSSLAHPICGFSLYTTKTQIEEDKDPDAGRDWRQEEKGTTEAEMVGRHRRLNGHEFEHALGDGEGQGSLVCCSPWLDKRTAITKTEVHFVNISWGRTIWDRRWDLEKLRREEVDCAMLAKFQKLKRALTTWRIQDFP